jgi:hypothetical protein
MANVGRRIICYYPVHDKYRRSLIRIIGRTYTNLWGGGVETKDLTQHSKPAQQESIQNADSWKLDWEEDGR